ncbi:MULTISPECIES: RNA-guided endonuclease InsQ/TnpB family protein [Clostridium]|mgnify:FL=1|jgi:putative transposase|uniref:RNA-guided endonuclease InsQ/TnpB family protein n=1 Tax=Clostridium TaxID=1485 RepID=UPI0024300E85|nr:transposase [Clostridium tyrobutyricum]
MQSCKDEKDYEHRTYQFRIKKNNPLFEYCDEMCFKAKNLYNIANFYVRQAFSGIKKEPELRHDNETMVINTVNSCIKELNHIKVITFEKRKNYNYTDKTKAKKKTKPALFRELDKNNSFISWCLLDGVFKLNKQADYKNLPAQTNQAVLKLLNQDWKSFFNALKEYKINPCKFKGRPKMPRYAKKNGRKVAAFTNQSCKIKTKNDKYYLIFPKTNLTLDIGEIGLKANNLKEVRIIPSSNFYTVEMVVAVPKPVINEKGTRIIAIDLGVNNLATIANNVGLTPIIIKGRILKARNQFYNKYRAKYYSILRNGKGTNEGQFTSNRLNKLDTDRHYFIKDYFHKASRMIINYCIDNKIDTIVIGKNKHWKDDIAMRKDAKQSFTNIPYNQFISMITYKANEKGIKVIETEESYTSKASFIDNDYIPTYGIDDEKAKFSGRRISRGMYKSKDGILINADVNGACNILRKVFPMAFSNKDLRNSGAVNAPMSLIVA